MQTYLSKKPALCPVCSAPQNCHSCISDEFKMPVEGDFSVCIRCGMVSVYVNAFNLRKATKEDWDILKCNSPNEWEILQKFLTNFDNFKKETFCKFCKKPTDLHIDFYIKIKSSSQENEEFLSDDMESRGYSKKHCYCCGECSKDKEKIVLLIKFNETINGIMKKYQNGELLLAEEKELLELDNINIGEV